MTTTHIRTTCIVCGHEAFQPAAPSGREADGVGLDLRPAGEAHAALAPQVQSCEQCGYCYPAVDRLPGWAPPRSANGRPRRNGDPDDAARPPSELLEAVQRVVNQRIYQALLNTALFPDLAGHFLCWGRIEEYSGSLHTSALATLRAAWVCDDAALEEPARTCRLRAASLLQSELDRARSEDPAADAVLLADLLRRAGEFDRARQACEEALSLDPPPDAETRALLVFEQALCERQDSTAHRRDEAYEHTG